MELSVEDVDEDEVNKEGAIDLSEFDNPKDAVREVIKASESLELDEDELDEAFEEAKDKVSLK